MSTSQNGWPVLGSGSLQLYTWVIPAKNGTARIKLRNGSAGFLLAVYALWFAEKVQPIAGALLDDWGYAYRPVRGQSSGFSNHASGTAIDLNATRHPLGRRGTFATVQYLLMRARLVHFAGTLRSGIDYQNRPDEMHTEINAPLPVVEKVARRMMLTPRGRRVLAANPSQRKVIES